MKNVVLCAIYLYLWKKNRITSKTRGEGLQTIWILDRRKLVNKYFQELVLLEGLYRPTINGTKTCYGLTVKKRKK